MADRPLSNLLVRVSADISNFTQGMDRVGKRGQQAEKKIFGMTSRSIAGFAAVGAAVVKVGADLGRLGADVAEIESKFLTVTGASASMANEWINSFGEMAGFTESEGQKMIGNLANVALGAGFAEDAATDFAVAAAQLAGDLGSFNNTPTADVARDIQSALTGSTETMQKYGIVLKQAAVDARAMEMRSDDVTGALTQQERSLAALNIIYEQAGPAVGDVVRTQDSAANAAKQLSRDFRQLKEDVGTAVVPAFQAVVGILQTAFNAMQVFGSKISEAALIVGRFFARLKGDDGAVRLYTDRIRIARAETERLFQVWMDDGATAADQAAVDLDALNTRLARQAGLLSNISTRELPAVATAMGDFGEISVAAVSMIGPTTADATRHLKLMGVQATATENKVMGIANAARGLFSVFTSGGSFLSKIGGVLGAVSPFLSLIPGVGTIAGIAGGALGGILQGFADGGNIPAGGVGLVGERGPELISGPAAITPMDTGGMGQINISLVMDTGRQLVDTITVKQDRDRDVRRIIRVPVSAVAVG